MNINFNLRIFSFNWNISISRQWMRFGIIVTVILAAVITSYWAPPAISSLLLVVMTGIAGTLILLQHPNLGFILLFLAGFIKLQGPGQVNASALVVALLIALWLLDMLVVKRRFQVVNSRPLLPVFVFLVVSMVAFGMGQVPWFVFANQAPLDAQVGGFAIFVLSAGLLLLVAHRVQHLRWLKIIMWTFISIGALYVLGRAAKFSYIDQLYPYGLSNGSMLWTWLVALVLGQAMFNIHLKTRIRVLLAVIVLITLYVAYVQANDWKSGWVPPLVCVAVLVSIRYKRLVAFVIPVTLVAVVYATGQLIASDEYSWGTRVDAWIIILTISRVSPLLGMGFSNYYWYTPLFPIRGWSVSFNSHNQYVDLIAEVGVIGLLCFLWIFLEVGKLSWKLGNQLPDGFARSYSYSVLAGIAGTLMAAFLVDWVLPFVYNIGFNGFRASILPWIFFGGLISIEQIYLTRTKS